MGCITSRGDNWPPKPYRRVVVRTVVHDCGRSLFDASGVRCRENPIETVEDYVWVYPSAATANCCGWVYAGYGDPAEEASPGQEMAIRNLEDR